eukprot:m.102384 g.102384  ORF g.102384 m.102384 type:complete len:1250 (-) comp20805_c0_seq1:200-3949(-)
MFGCGCRSSHHRPLETPRMEASPVPSVGSDDGIRHDSWTSGSGGEFVGVGSGSSADENVEKASTDKGYKDIISSWNESVIHATPSIIWQSSFLGEGEGWDRETGVLAAHRVAARAFGAAAGAAAGATIIVVGVVTVGLGLIVAGAAGAVHVFRTRRQRSHDKISGIVDWQEWQPEANRLGGVIAKVVNTSALAQTVGESSETLLLNGVDTALTITIPTKSVPCLLCVELFREANITRPLFQLNIQLDTKDKVSHVDLFYNGKRVGSAEVTSIARFRTCMAETFATTEGKDAAAPYHLWLALSNDSICVGFGDIPLHASAIWFTKPKGDHSLPSRVVYRVATPVVKDASAGVMPDVSITLATQPTFKGALSTSLRRREAAVALISNLEYHMHKKSGFLRVLRGQMYIYHIERDFRTHSLRVIVTAGHVVLMRRATGPASKLHLHNQYRTLGIIDLASVFRIDKLRARYHDVDILKLDAVDMSTLLIPALSVETETAILWFVNKLDQDRTRLSEQIPLLLRYSLLGECSKCQNITFSGGRLGLTLDGALACLTDCTCAVHTRRLTTIASIADVDGNRHDASAPIYVGDAKACGGAGTSIRGRSGNVLRSQFPKAKSASKYPTTLSLRIACRGMMVTGEVMSPMCVVLQQKEVKSRKHWIELGRTEFAYNSYNPDYTQTLLVTLPDQSSVIVVEVHLINACHVAVDSKPKTKEEDAATQGSPPHVAAPGSHGRESMAPDVAYGGVASFYGSATFTAASLLAGRSDPVPVVAAPIRRARYERSNFGSVELTVLPPPSQSTLDNELFLDVRQLVGEGFESVRQLARSGAGKKSDLIKLFHDKLCRRFATESVTAADIALTIINLNMSELHVLFGVGAGRDYNESLLGLLSGDLASKLTTEAKLRMICMLAPLKRSDAQQQFLIRIILSAHGLELFHLKDGVDIDQSSVIDMSRLVFSVLQDPEDQLRILEHLAKEAAALTATGFQRPLRVLSDIDDTLVHSGFGLGGPKYKAGTILPGFVPLLRSLQARVAFVTARPAFIKKFTYKTLRNQYGIPDAVCLSGELIDSVLIPFAPDYSNEKIAARKVNNILRYMQVFPECDFFWFGDTGQGDAIVGEKLLTNDATKEQLKGVFIQDVVKSNGYHYKTPSAERARSTAAGIDIVDNYLDVALALYERGFLPVAGLKRVAVATAKQVRALLIDPHDPGIIVARVLEHERRLAGINLVITAEQSAPLHHAEGTTGSIPEEKTAEDDAV